MRLVFSLVLMSSWIVIAQAQAALLNLLHQHVVFGEAIGYAGSNIVDLDGDGLNEIVLGATHLYSGYVNATPNNTWYVVRYENGDYIIRYTAPIYTEPVTAVRVKDVLGDARPEIVVAAGRTIYIYDSLTYRELQRTTSIALTVSGLEIVDIDSDTRLEYVFCDQNALYIYDVLTGQLERQFVGYGGVCLAVGNVDADRPLEIIIANDASPGYVIQGTTGQVEWVNPAGFGRVVLVGDFNNDDIQEIASMFGNGTLRVYDARHTRLVYEIITGSQLDAALLADFDGDRLLDILVGQSQSGRVHIFNGFVGALLGTFRAPGSSSGSSGLAFGDVNADGRSELILGIGYRSSSADNLYVVSPSTLQVQWMSHHLGTPFSGLAVGDVNHDGETEIVYGCLDTDSGYDGGQWFLRSAINWSLISASSRLPVGQKITRIAVANIDHDPQLEIFVAAVGNYQVLCVDGSTLAQQYLTDPIFERVLGLQVKDVDLDNNNEVVVSGSRMLSVFNGQTGAVQRAIPLSNGTYSLLRIGNIDQDPQPEIVVGARNSSGIYIIDVFETTRQIFTSMALSALELYDFDSDGKKELIVGSVSGNLAVINPENGSTLRIIANFGGRIDGLAIADVAGGTEPDFVFVVGGRINIYYDHPQSGVYGRWQSAVIGPNAGFDDTLLVTDFEDDGDHEVVLNTGRGIAVFTIERNRFVVGDVNLDGCVDGVDLLAVLFDFGSIGPNRQADLNSDQRVDDTDLMMVIFNFGTGC